MIYWAHHILTENWGGNKKKKVGRGVNEKNNIMINKRFFKAAQPEIVVLVPEEAAVAGRGRDYLDPDRQRDGWDEVGGVVLLRPRGLNRERDVSLGNALKFGSLRPKIGVSIRNVYYLYFLHIYLWLHIYILSITKLYLT